MRKTKLAKRVLSVVLSAAVALSSGAFGGLVFERKAEAATGTYTDTDTKIQWSYTIEGTGENAVAVNMYTSNNITDAKLSNGALEVPNTVIDDDTEEEYPVRSIGDGKVAESGGTSFLRGTIGASSVTVDLSGMEHLEEIIGYAFYNDSTGNMDKVRVENLPEGLKKIGAYAFNGTVCGELNGTIWDFSVPSSVEVMGCAALNKENVRMEVKNPNMVYESKEPMNLYKALGYAHSTTKEIYGSAMGSISGEDKSLQVSFDIDGGYFKDGEENEHLVNYIYTYPGMKLPALKNTPLKENYLFRGYEGVGTDGTVLYYNSDKSVNGEHKTDEGMTALKAVWSPETYDITYELNGGVWADGVEAPQTYTYGEGAQLPQLSQSDSISSVTRTGYMAMGWYCDGEELERISGTDSGNKTVSVEWMSKPYATRYYLNGASLKEGYDYTYYTTGYYQDNSRTYNADYTVWTQDMLENEGYEFEGWYDAEFKVPFGEVIEADTVAGRLDMYAKWNPKTYKIEYDVDNGVLGKDTKYEFTFNQPQEFPEVAKTGYDFMGWYTNKDCTGSAISAVEVTKTQNLKYYAKWEPKTFGVKLETGGGTIEKGNVENYTYDKGAKLPQDVTRTGYDFLGWYDNASFRGEPVTEIKANDAENLNDRNYFARWKEHVYGVKLLPDGGKLEKELTEYTYGTGAVLPVPEKTGYHFMGWYDSEGVKVEGISGTDAKDYTLTAKWNAKQFSVEYDAQGGELSGSYPSFWRYDKDCQLPTNLTRTGYDFDGWYLFGERVDAVKKIAAFDTDVLAKAEGAGKVTLTAKWNPKSYQVTFNENGGTLENNIGIAVEYGECYENLPQPKKTGFVFTGWYTALTDGELVNGNTRCETASNHTLYAGWVKAEWTVNLNLADGVADVTSIRVAYGVPYTSLPTPSKKGYTFTGWTTPSGDVVSNTSNVTIDADHTLTAGWASNLDGTEVKIETGGNTDPGVYTDITEIELLENTDVPAWYQGRSDGYFYRNALDGVEKKLYAAFFSWFKGGYNIGSKAHFKMVDSLAYEEFYEKLYTAIEAFCSDHPEFSMCQQILVSFPEIEGNKNGVFYMECSAYSGYDRTLAISINNTLGNDGAFLDAVSKVGITKKDNDFQKVKKIHDYVVGRLCYANPDTNGEYSNEKRDPGFAFLNSSSENPDYGVVCVGYAKLFKVFCNYFGVESVLLGGDNHEWNNVQIDGKWYVVDCTNDDAADGVNMTYDYFLVGNDFQFKAAGRLENEFPSLESDGYVMTKVVGGIQYTLPAADSKGVVVSGITKAVKNKASVSVPANVKIGGGAYKVTKIANNAFKNCKKLKKVTIGKNVTSIGKNTFLGCKKLAKVTVKTSGLKSIGKNAFKGTSKKLTVKVPKKMVKKYTAKMKKAGNKKIVVK